MKEYNEENKSGLEKLFLISVSFSVSVRERKFLFFKLSICTEVNPQIYYQLDLSKAKTGKYLITITVKDKVDGSKLVHKL